MTNYDIVFIGIVLVSSIFALIRGGICEILSLGTWIITLWGMSRFGATIGKFLPSAISNSILRWIIIFIVVFFITAIIIACIKKICSGLITKIGIEDTDHIVGLFVGVLRGVIICALVIIAINMMHLDANQSWKQAKLYPIIKPVVVYIVDLIPNNFN